MIIMMMMMIHTILSICKHQPRQGGVQSLRLAGVPARVEGGDEEDLREGGRILNKISKYYIYIYIYIHMYIYMSHIT